MPPAGRKQGARPGDATGREKERLAREAAPAIEEAATRVALTEAPVVERSDDVIDYTGGGAASAEEAAQKARRISVDEALADGQTEHTVDDLPESALTQEDLDALPDGRTDTRPATIQRTEEPQPAAQFAAPQPRQHPVPDGPVVQQSFKMMRVNTDLPDVTIGKDNHYTFRVEERYKVPKEVYDHLDEKGYVYH